MPGRLLHLDGTITAVEPIDPTQGYRLAELYKMLNCDMIEVVRLSDAFIMVIDEEGKCKGDPEINRNATALALAVSAIAHDDVIVGHALVCRDEEVK